MSLPVLHSFAGYSVYRLSKNEGERTRWGVALLCMFLANLADFDFIPGLSLGNPNLYHRLVTHSLAAALACGFIVGTVTVCLKKGSFLKHFLLSGGAYLTHIVLDYWSGPPKGVALFWPFSKRMFYFPESLYGRTHVEGGLDLAQSAGDFIRHIFSFRCFHACMMELTIVFSILAVAKAVGSRKKLHRSADSLVFGAVALTFAWIAFFVW